MKKRTVNVYGLLLMLSVCFVACKKDNNSKSNSALMGVWQQTPKESYNSTITFATDSKFSMDLVALENTSYLLTNSGKYSVKGDSLIVNVLQSVEKVGGKSEVRTFDNNNKNVLYEKATYSIKDNILTLSYISYPADAPIRTEVKFSKISGIK